MAGAGMPVGAEVRGQAGDPRDCNPRLRALGAAKSPCGDWHSRHKACAFHWRFGLVEPFASREGIAVVTPQSPAGDFAGAARHPSRLFQPAESPTPSPSGPRPPTRAKRRDRHPVRCVDVPAITGHGHRVCRRPGTAPAGLRPRTFGALGLNPKLGEKQHPSLRPAMPPRAPRPPAREQRGSSSPVPAPTQR
jgi:hypothetical protein